MSKKGRTRKPCHGCGEERGWRTQGEVCVSCKRLMADGRRYREETAEDPTLGLYRYSLDRLHWNEPIGVTSIPRGWGGDGPRRRLERAFHELVLLLVKRPPKLPSEVLKEAIRLLPAYSR